MGYQKRDEINGNYRVVSSSIVGDLDLINTIEAEGWKLFFVDSNNGTSYYYFKRIKSFSAQDRGKIDDIIHALQFLEKDKMLNYADEIDFLNNIRSW